jgi:hypothetical protein
VLRLSSATAGLRSADAGTLDRLDLLTAPAAAARPGVFGTAAVRVPIFDEVRGLFVLWMIGSHALTLAHLDAAHPLHQLWPRGWATTGFVLLTGLTLGSRHVQGQGRFDAGARQTLIRRALRLALIAVVSNIVFLLGREALQGRMTAAVARSTPCSSEARGASRRYCCRRPACCCLHPGCIAGWSAGVHRICLPSPLWRSRAWSWPSSTWRRRD